jgi:hypothetical protein
VENFQLFFEPIASPPLPNPIHPERSIEFSSAGDRLIKHFHEMACAIVRAAFEGSKIKFGHSKIDFESPGIDLESRHPKL